MEQTNNNTGGVSKGGKGPFLNLTVDTSFKSFLMYDPDLCICILKCYIAELRRRTIKTLRFLNNEPLPQQQESKHPRLDALVELDAHELVNVEMQYVFQHFFCARALYYWAVSYASALAKGKSYDTLRPTYVLLFTHFDIWPELKRICSSFSIRCNEQNELEFSPHLRIVVVNLNQLSKLSLEEVLKLDRGEILGYLIRNSSKLTSEELERIKQVDNTLNKAGEALQELSRNQRAILAVDQEEKQLRDIAAVRLTGERIGFEKGHEEGRAEGVQLGIVKGREEGLAKGDRQRQIDMARRMLRANKPLAEICEFTELSETEVRKL